MTELWDLEMKKVEVIARLRIAQYIPKTTSWNILDTPMEVISHRQDTLKITEFKRLLKIAEVDRATAEKKTIAAQKEMRSWRQKFIDSQQARLNQEKKLEENQRAIQEKHAHRLSKVEA